MTKIKSIIAAFILLFTLTKCNSQTTKTNKMEKLNEFTPEFKKETLKTLYKLYMELNNLNVDIAQKYNFEILEITYLDEMVRNTKHDLEMCTLFLKEKHTILTADNRKFLHFDCH